MAQEGFVIDNRFVDYDSSIEKKYPYGTNIVVTNNGTTDNPDYKFDVIPGFINTQDVLDKIEPIPIEDIEDLWINDEPDEEIALLLNGEDFSYKIENIYKASSSESDIYYLKYLMREYVLPLGLTSDNLISDPSSDTPIYAWMDGETMYYYTEASKITANVSMRNMFLRPRYILRTDLFNNIDTSNVTDMSFMFNSCSKFQSLDLSNIDTSNVTNMCNMFQYMYDLQSLDLSGFDTSKVNDMHYMFYDDRDLTTIKVSSNFVTSSVVTHNDMFKNCIKLVGGNGTVYDSSHTDKEYARIDAPGSPGYFTLKS